MSNIGVARGVVVTGASSGIGRACALRLDRLGFGVFAGVRRDEDGEVLKSAASHRLVPVIMDVTDAETIRRAADCVRREVKEVGLWGLVNNAGIVVAGPLEFLPVEEVRRQLEVNVIGQVAVTQAFVPLLRKAGGRIVNIGSISGRLALPLLGPYCASKFALEAITAALRMELASSGISVSIVEPGGIATPIWSKGLSRGDDLAAQMPGELHERYGKIIARQRQRATRSDLTGLPPDIVARSVAHALTAPRPRRRYIIGRSARFGEVGRLIPESLREWLILRLVARQR
jgi:NAD(P)-dependent dehydrogenase (short-subunit alcohol dehydrogenase family)